MLTNLRRVLKFAIQGFMRNFWLSLANIIILVLTLLTINFLIVFNLLTINSINLVKDKIDISLYFKQNISNEDIEDVRHKIASSEYIKSVEYVSSEQALNNFQKRHAKDENILKAIDQLQKDDNGNVFVASLKVKAKDISMYNQILTELKQSQYSGLFEIDEAQFQDYTKITERLNSISNKIKLIGYIVSIIFVLITLMMVYNTIKIAVYTHKDEISIMKLVGATPNFIKAPFFVEILLYNFLALLIVIALFYIGSIFAQPLIDKLFEMYSFNLIKYFNKNFVLIFLGQFVVSSLFSLSCSFIAMKKYLRY